MILARQIESLDGFQNTDDCEDWLWHEPKFEWTAEELREFERERQMEEAYYRQMQEAMAGWWEIEGVRCATFGRDPNENPYA